MAVMVGRLHNEIENLGEELRHPAHRKCPLTRLTGLYQPAHTLIQFTRTLGGAYNLRGHSGEPMRLHPSALVEWIDDHWTVVLFCLALVAFGAPFIVTDGFEHVWLVVPFAFALVILPGLSVSTRWRYQ